MPFKDREQALAYLKNYRETHKKERKEYYILHHEELLAAQRKYKAEHTEERKTWWKQYRIKNLEAVRKKARDFYRNNKEEIRAKTNEKRRQEHLEILEHYGGRCVCCGETISEFLALDHINGGGHLQRKELGSRFYTWIRKNNYPATLQILCHNCNMAKGFYGECPHERIRREAESV